MKKIEISVNLLMRTDLNTYEKMCCVVIGSLDSLEEPFSLALLAERMGCSVDRAEATIRGLAEKGLLQPEAMEEVVLDPVRKQDHSSPAAQFRKFKDSREMKEQLEVLRSFIQEPVSDQTLKIVLNMASGDLDRIKSCYQRAQLMQISDNLEALMNFLQKEERGEDCQMRVLSEENFESGLVLDSVSTEEENVREVEKSEETDARQILTQINQRRIAELYEKSRGKK